MDRRVTFFHSPNTRSSGILALLRELDADYALKVLNMKAGEQRAPAYLAINPMGKVPAIVHDGNVVTECAAICAYLADAYPEAGLQPNADERADYYRWMFFAAGPLEQAILAHTLGFEPEDERQQAVAGFGSFERTLDTLEGHLKDHTFVCGDRFTMADVYVGSHVDWGLTFGTLPKRPAFLAYAERCQARTAYQAGKAIDNELIARMQSNA